MFKLAIKHIKFKLKGVLFHKAVGKPFKGSFP